MGLPYNPDLVGRDFTSTLEHVRIAAGEGRPAVSQAVVSPALGTPAVGIAHPDGDGVHITVEDASPGVPDALKQTIFKPFQLGDTAAARIGGTGIGLALVDRFTALQHGRCWVTDRPGGGAAFHVWIPGRSDANPRARSRSDTAQTSAPDSSAAKSAADCAV